MNWIRTSPTRWPYDLSRLRADEPERSFSYAPSVAELAHFGVFLVVPTEQPEHDPSLQRVVEIAPEKINGQWRQQWQVIELSAAEIEAIYQATHPPRWVEFGEAVQSNPAINALLGAALENVPALAMALSVGLGKAADGDQRVFLSAWSAAQSLGLVSQELVAGVQTLAVAHDLPAEFVEGLA
jgi:hypothetical protein